MVDLTNFDDEMKKRVTEVKSIIESYLPEEEGFQRTLLEAVNYSMLVGGKKLRPLLMQQTYAMFGGTSPAIRPFMAAIEMIHTHSLIHDDLPAMDNDEYRRGKKTTHVVYGEAMAILAGDALLNYAYETAAKAFDLDPGNPRLGKAFQILAAKTGLDGMIGGQSVDVEYVDKPLTQEQLFFIYKLKTSALIEASMMIGAVLAGATQEETEKIERIARNVGLAFQIQDDILDVVGEEETLGKPTKSDEKNKKTTYVTVKGLEKAQTDVAKYSEEAIRIMEELPYENEFLHELILHLIHRNA
ncbi:MAG: polyprenyl synthetase family protein [Lachnospiraceae bacterium]|nr:polyprenyl synthetase family protein [Lachnospiraceae bacterium]MDD7076730.1 polyprenyl synthetase family protein [Lachnospiraceae bacterium]MDY3729111.1 farnesyl diphosphate synthase [Candidatus Choladocola sp.]